MFSKAGFLTFIYGTRIDNAAAPAFLKFRSSNGFIVASIAIAIFTDIFLYSMVVPVLPFAFTVRAGVGEKDVQKWTSVFLSVYGAALAIGSPIFGWFADKSTSRRAPLLLGLLALGGATGMLTAGSSLPVLIIGRLLQGLSAAVVWTVGLALLSDTVEKENIGQAMGYIAAATSVGSLLGPLLGGVVYASAGYYAVFAMGFALIGLDIVLRFLLIEKRVALQWSTSTETSLESDSSNAVGTAKNEDEIQPTTNVTAPNGTIMSEKTPAASIVFTSARKLPPLITLLGVPRILVALFGCFVQAATLASFDSVLPLFVKKTFGWDSSGAGLIFICLVVPALLSPFVGIFSDKFGSRSITTIGLLGALPAWVLFRLVTHNSIGQKVLLGALLSLIGFFMTLVMAPLMAEIDHGVALEEKKKPGSLGKRGAAAQGFGLFNLAYALGTLVGPLFAGFVVQKAGLGTLGWAMAILNGVCAVATFFWTGGRIMLRGKERHEESQGGIDLGV